MDIKSSKSTDPPSRFTTATVSCQTHFHIPAKLLLTQPLCLGENSGAPRQETIKPL